MADVTLSNSALPVRPALNWRLLAALLADVAIWGALISGAAFLISKSLA